MAGMIPITPRIALREDELVEQHLRASGPGGQHVNTTSTAIELRFDIAGSPSLPDDLRARLLAWPDRRITREGVLVIHAGEHRSQTRNRVAAVERLVALIREATAVRRTRRPTRPTRASNTRRLDGKTRRSAIKANRRGGDGEG